MNLLDRNRSSSWKHPFAVSLLRKYEYEFTIEDIIEIETRKLLTGLTEQFPSMFANGSPVTPIEELATSLSISITRRNCGLGFSATLKQTNTGYEVSRDMDQHYYRQRFSFAHEVGHVVLSKLAGPLNNKALHVAKDARYEEEVMCDLFASALLMPRAAFEALLDENRLFNDRDVTRLAREFRVSKGSVLRRIAGLQRYILILWDLTQNPRKKRSSKAERIVQVYPFISQLSSYFIPLFCTLDNERFAPNIILDSFESGCVLAGKVRISHLGSIPTGEYFIHNIPFQKWNENLLEPNIIRKPKHFFNMATFLRV